MSALSDLFRDIAAAIKSKTGSTTKLKPIDFPKAINEMPIGDNVLSERYAKIINCLRNRKTKGLTDKEGLFYIPEIYEGGKLNVGLSEYSYTGFDDMQYCKLDSVFLVNNYSIAHNPELKILDISVPDAPFDGIIFYENALYGCNKLESIIIRPNSAGSMDYASFETGATNNTNSTFLVYVPTACYDACVSEQININSGMASRFRKLEDYPEIDNWNS